MGNGDLTLKHGRRTSNITQCENWYAAGNSEQLHFDVCFYSHSVEQVAARFVKFTSTAGGFYMCSVPFL